MIKFKRLCAVMLLVGLVGVAFGGITKINTFVVEETWANCVGVCDNEAGGPCTAVFPCLDQSACFGIGDPIPLNIDPRADGMVSVPASWRAWDTI